MVRVVIGLLGAALVTAGAAMIYVPAGFIVGGLFLLMIDRNTPAPAARE